MILNFSVVLESLCSLTLFSLFSSLVLWQWERLGRGVDRPHLILSIASPVFFSYKILSRSACHTQTTKYIHWTFRRSRSKFMGTFIELVCAKISPMYYVQVCMCVFFLYMLFKASSCFLMSNCNFSVIYKLDVMCTADSNWLASSDQKIFFGDCLDGIVSYTTNSNVYF